MNVSSVYFSILITSVIPFDRIPTMQENGIRLYFKRSFILKSSIFRDTRPCSLLKIKQSSACQLLHSSFSLDLFFDPEDGGDMFLRNIS
jgi:hypothetical protein